MNNENHKQTNCVFCNLSSLPKEDKIAISVRTNGRITGYALISAKRYDEIIKEYKDKYGEESRYLTVEINR